MFSVWRWFLRRCWLGGVYRLFRWNLLGDRLCDLRYLCSGNVHWRQHFCVHGVSRWVLLRHFWLRLLHHVHVGYLRRRRFRELHQLLCGLLLSVVVGVVLSVRSRHLLWSWFSSVHHVHGWNLCRHGLSDLLTLCGRHLLCQWLWHLHEVHWRNGFWCRFCVLRNVQCWQVRGPRLRHLLQLCRR